MWGCDLPGALSLALYICLVLLLAPANAKAHATNSTTDPEKYVLLNLTRNWIQEPQVLLSVGSPPQPMQFLIDLQTAELAISARCDIGANVFMVDGYHQQCCVPGQSVSSCFDSNVSTTFHVNSTEVSSSVNVTYVQDTIGFGINGTANLNVSQAIIMLSQGNATLGLGPKAAEQVVVTFHDGEPWPSYDTLPYLLHAQGKTSSSTFSYYSGGWNPVNTPQLLFGGIDTSKFVPGSMAKVPIVNGLSSFITSYQALSESAGNAPDSVNIMVHGLWTNVGDSPSVQLVESSFAASVDFSKQSSFPGIFSQALMDMYGWYAYENSQLILPCNGVQNMNLTVNVSGIPLSAPLQNFVEPLGPVQVYSNSGEHTYDLGDVCLFTASRVSSPGTVMVIGKEFLEFAYIALDYDNYELAFAELEPTTTDQAPKIEIAKSGFPNVSQAPMYSSTSATLSFEDYVWSTAPRWTTFDPSMTSALLIQGNVFTYLDPMYSRGQLITTSAYDPNFFGQIETSTTINLGNSGAQQRSWLILFWSTFMMFV